MGDKKFEIILNGLNCAHCAEVINQKVKELDDIENGDLNFINKKLTIIIKKDRQEENVIKTVVDIINNTEPGLNINILKNNKEYNDGQNININEEDTDSSKKDLIKLIVGFSIYAVAIYQNS